MVLGLETERLLDFQDGDKTSIPKTDCAEASNILLDKADPEVAVSVIPNKPNGPGVAKNLRAQTKG